MEEQKPDTVESLRKALADLGLYTGGKKAQLKNRLRKANIKNEQTNDDEETQPIQDSPIESLAKKPSRITKQPFDYYLFFDVEATCQKDGGFDYPNEIIEFPVVLVDGLTFEKVDEYRSYVKPSKFPVLSEYCKSLTGISQETVDGSPGFVEVLDEFQAFMQKYSLFQHHSAVFVTDGPFDIRDFVTKQCVHSKIGLPEYFKEPWINIRKLFKDFYNYEESKNISRMLEACGMTFEGQEHSGLDDARNIMRIAQKMYNDGCVFKTNMFWGPKMRALQRRSRKLKS